MPDEPQSIRPQKLSLQRLLPHLPFLILILVLVGIGWQIYRDFGYSWDEKYQLSIAKTNYDFISGRNQDLLTFRDRYYGPFFELTFYRYFQQFDFPELEYQRHRVFYLLFLSGVTGFYLLGYQLFKKAKWAFLAAAMLALSPRIFADAFFNAKDIPLMVAFIWAVCAIVFLAGMLKRERSWLEIGFAIVITSITMAMALSTRILGIFLVAIFLMVMVLLLIHSPKQWKKLTVVSVLVLGGMLGFTMWFWPIMRIDPLGGLVKAFVYMSHYPYNPPNLYFGTFIDAAQLPWHYLPVWLSITNPLLVVFGVYAGQLAIAVRFFRQTGWKDLLRKSMNFALQQPEWLAVFAWGYGPIAAILLFNSILYDGWRQMFFIYPAFVLLAAAGLRAIFEWVTEHWIQSKVVQPVLIGLILLGFVEPLWFMVQQHPHENVYFNPLAGDPATLRYRFEMDYWGLSYKQAIEKLLELDDAPLIKINVENSPGRSYLKYMLTPEQAQRVKMVDDPASADYYITNYRLHPADYDYPVKVHAIEVRGSEIIAVYKTHP